MPLDLSSVVVAVTGPQGPAGNNGTNGTNGVFSEIASEAEAQAGVENTKGMTPLRVKQSITANAGSGGGGRTLLTASRTYYVRTDGSDSNNGLTDASGGAFLTIQKAIDVASTLDNGGFDVIIQIGDGTYTPANNNLKSFVGSGKIIIRGNAVTPANVLINSSGSCFAADNVRGYQIEHLEMRGNYCVDCINGSLVYLGAGLRFGASGFHLRSFSNSTIQATANYSITGGASVYHCWVNQAGIVTVDNRVIAVSAGLTFNTFVEASNLGFANWYGTTFSTTTATGKRYNVISYAIIDTGGGGANRFPGSTAGSASGGLYL